MILTFSFVKAPAILLNWMGLSLQVVSLCRKMQKCYQRLERALSRFRASCYNCCKMQSLCFHEIEGVSSVFLRLASGSSSSSCLLIPFSASGPNRDTCLLVMVRPALSFGPQCLSGFGRKRATFLACALLRDAAARAKLACGGRKHNGWLEKLLTNTDKDSHLYNQIITMFYIWY